MVKNFIVVDNMEMVSYVIVVFNFYLCVKKDFVFLLRGVIDDFEIFQVFSEIVYVMVDFMQMFFIILIVSIFVVVVQICGLGYFFCDFWVFFMLEIIKFLFEFFIFFLGNQGCFYFVDFFCLFDNVYIGYNVIILIELIMFC